MATTILTGATGLIGAHLMEVFNEGEVLPIIRAEMDLLVPGVLADLVRRAMPTTVVHLAWCASGTPGYRGSGENAEWLDRSAELVAACRETGSHLVLTGTVSDDGSASDAYSRAKSSLRTLARDAHSRQALTLVRPHYVFDPGRGRPQLVADALASLRSRAAVELADPHAQHDFVHAADVASALLVVIKRQLLGELDIGSGTLHEVRELVEALEVPWVRSGREASNTSSSPAADIAPLIRQGWEPRHTFHFFGESRRTNDR